MVSEIILCCAHYIRTKALLLGAPFKQCKLSFKKETGFIDTSWSKPGSGARWAVVWNCPFTCRYVGGDGGEFLILGDTQPFHSQAPKAISVSLWCLLPQPAWSGNRSLVTQLHSQTCSPGVPVCRERPLWWGLHPLGQDRSPALCPHLCVSLAQPAFPEGSPSSTHWSQWHATVPHFVSSLKAA